MNCFTHIEKEVIWVESLRMRPSKTSQGHWLASKKITTEMVDIFRIVNGKLVEYRDVNNNLDFLKKTRHYRIHRKRKETLSRRYHITVLVNISSIQVFKYLL
jgi:hypothetical protein